MKVYLDNCSLQRPLDTKTQSRILFEAEAMLLVMDWIHLGRVEVIASEALSFEIGRNPNPARKEFAVEFLAKAAYFQAADRRTVVRARGFVDQGVEPMDALHLASAISAGAHYFCTCDDKLLAKGRILAAREIQVVSPLELVAEIDDASTAQATE